MVHGFPPGVALELVIDLFERLLDYCTDRHAGVIFFGKRDGRFTKLGFLDGRVGDMELLPAAARTLQVAITAFHGGVLFSPFQWRRALASNSSQVESFARECSAESVIGQLGSLHVLVVLPVGGDRIERLSFSRASEFVALLDGLFENLLLGGRESAV